MIEHATRREMENNRYLYVDLLMMAHMVDIIYANYLEKMKQEEHDKEREEDDAPSTRSSEKSYFS